MLRTATEYLRARLKQRGDLIPLGFSWAFVVTVDVSLAAIVLVATLQRPTADLPVALLAATVAVSPLVLFFVSGIAFNPAVLWGASTTATVLFLFATTTPVATDYAPLLLVLMLGVVSSLTTLPGSMAAATTAAAVLVTAAAVHRLDGLAIYLPVLGMGWLVGYLMHTQQQLMIEQERAQAAQTEHAAADERRRIALEVHDVIAHSLSITLLHLTGARRGLQQDNDIDEAVAALEQAEQLGRQAMGDIRRTVGLLDSAPMRTTPEPGVDDIVNLVSDFTRAGLAVELSTDGATDRISPAVGLALYRIAQESLTNVAKHSPSSNSTVQLAVSPSAAVLSVTSELPATKLSGAVSTGRGLPGMRQRIEQLDGVLDAGPADQQWVVRARIPLDDAGTFGQWRCKA